MAIGGGARGGNKRAMFFWAVEWVYAIIGGAFEAYVYHAYTPKGADDYVAWGESITRACITQILVVLLAVAAVEAWKIKAHFLAKFTLFLSIQVFAVLFAFVAFWLMRVAAMAFQQTDILGVALDATLPVPFVGQVPAQELTLDIVAGLPFFQLVINIFAPIITRDRAERTIEELKQDAERSRLMAEITEANARGFVTRWAGVARHAAKEITGKKDDAASQGNGDDPSPDNILAFPGQGGADGAGSSQERTAASRGKSRGAKAPGGLPGTHIDAEGLLAYIHDTLHRDDVTLSDVKAWLPQQKGAARADASHPKGIALVGGPYILPKLSAYAMAKKRWPRLEGAEPSVREIAD